MYICICKGVTDSAIRDAVYQGADRMRDLKSCLGVTAQCGQCACHAKEVLDQTRSQKAEQSNQSASIAPIHLLQSV